MSIGSMKATKIFTVIAITYVILLNSCDGLPKERTLEHFGSNGFPRNIIGTTEHGRIRRSTAGTSHHVQTTVGYLASAARFGETAPCFINGSSNSYSNGQSVYIDGSTGFLDGTVCWVEGNTNDKRQGETCYAKGNVSNVNRTNVVENACVVEESWGFLMENKYTQGVSPHAENSGKNVCYITVTGTGYVKDNVLFGVGTTGYFNGTLCSILGTRSGGLGKCTMDGTTGNVNGTDGSVSGTVCYKKFSSTYFLGNGFRKMPTSFTPCPVQEVNKINDNNNNDTQNNNNADNKTSISTVKNNKNTVINVEFSQNNPVGGQFHMEPISQFWNLTVKIRQNN